MAQRIYVNHQKIVETQVYQEKHQIEVKALLYIRLRLFLIQKCLSTVISPETDLAKDVANTCTKYNRLGDQEEVEQ